MGFSVFLTVLIPVIFDENAETNIKRDKKFQSENDLDGLKITWKLIHKNIFNLLPFSYLCSRSEIKIYYVSIFCSYLFDVWLKIKSEKRKLRQFMHFLSPCGSWAFFSEWKSLTIATRGKDFLVFFYFEKKFLKNQSCPPREDRIDFWKSILSSRRGQDWFF